MVADNENTNSAMPWLDLWLEAKQTNKPQLLIDRADAYITCPQEDVAFIKVNIQQVFGERIDIVEWELAVERAKKSIHDTKASELCTRAITENNPRLVFDRADLLAQCSDWKYEEIRKKLKDALGDQINLNGLDGAMKQARVRVRKQAFEDSCHGLPAISVSDRPLRDVSDDALDAVMKSPGSENLYYRQRAIVQSTVNDDGKPVLKALHEAHIVGLLTRAANFYAGKGDTPTHCDPSGNLVRDLLIREDWPIPVIAGIIETPTIRPAGTLLAAPGYDAETRLLYVPMPGLMMPKIPDMPTSTELQQALAVLQELICDFPFTDHASTANALAAIITPVLRPAIDGPIPL
ncbi:MAG: hypothetical protein ACRERE_19935 [Candidatus Entotheonellia bacterium]